MIVALMIGRSGSKGLRGKNTLKVLGKPLCEYPLLAAKRSKYVNKIFVSTDCPIISKVAKKYKVTQIVRPKKLCTAQALGEDVFKHGYHVIKKVLKLENKKIELLVLLMANAATITPKMIDSGIRFLKNNKKFDSAVSTSIYNMWSPLRARKLDKNGFLKPFVPFKAFGNPRKLNCDRDSQGDVFFADMSISIVRPKCLEKLKYGLLPQKWMGKNILPISCSGGLDIDFEWQIPQINFLLKKNGKKNSK